MAMTALREAPGLFLCDCPQQEVMSPICSRPLLTQEMEQRGIFACLTVWLVTNQSLSVAAQDTNNITSGFLSGFEVAEAQGPQHSQGRHVKIQRSIVCVCAWNMLLQATWL